MSPELDDVVLETVSARGWMDRCWSTGQRERRQLPSPGTERGPPFACSRRENERWARDESCRQACFRSSGVRSFSSFRSASYSSLKSAL